MTDLHLVEAPPGLPEVDRLVDLPHPDPEIPASLLFRFWPAGQAWARRLPGDDDRYVAVVPKLYTWALIVGTVNDESGFRDRWCYEGLLSAVLAASVWDGRGEPDGWHRHPATGRRRTHGDPTTEYIAP